MASAPGPVLSSPLGPPSPLSCQHPCSLPAACPAFSPRVGLAHPLRVALGTGRSGGHTLMLEATRATRVVCTPRTTPACIESPGLRPHLIGRCLPKAKRWDWGGAKQAVLGWVQKTSSLYKLIVTIWSQQEGWPWVWWGLEKPLRQCAVMVGILNAGEHSRTLEMVQTMWYTKACLCILCVCVCVCVCIPSWHWRLLDYTCVLYFATAPATPGCPHRPSSPLMYITTLPARTGVQEPEMGKWSDGLRPDPHHTSSLPG